MDEKIWSEDEILDELKNDAPFIMDNNEIDSIKAIVKDQEKITYHIIRDEGVAKQYFLKSEKKFQRLQAFIFLISLDLNNEYIANSNYSYSFFSKKVDFTGAQFSAEASFFQTRFSEEVFFRKAHFLGKVYFTGIQFSRRVDFTGAQFSEEAFFNKTQFSGKAYFNKTQFSDEMSAINAQFLQGASFSETRFSGTAGFSGSQFSTEAFFSKVQFFKDAFFNGTKFSTGAFFNNAKFSKRAFFESTQFSGNAYFSEAIFSGNTYFNEALFSGPTIFNQAKFYHIINFNQSYFAIFDGNEVSSLNFEGTIIEQAVFWKNPKLIDYSFKNSFFLSFSFAEKELLNCDFTGAVFDAVRTRGWKPNQATLDNTKYIYTDYKIVKETDEEGKIHKVYKAKEESRVPAEGNFGKDDNKDFTIADYLLEPYKWSYSTQLPQEIRTSVVNYINFFTDFIQTTHAMEVSINTRKEGSRIRIEFETTNKDDKTVIEEKFKDYFNNLGKDFNDIEFNWQNPSANDTEKDLLLIRYENIINNLKTEIKYLQKLLQKEEKHNKIISRILADVTGKNPSVILKKIIVRANGGDSLTINDSRKIVIKKKIKKIIKKHELSEQSAILFIEAFKSLNKEEQEKIKEQSQKENPKVKSMLQKGFEALTINAIPILHSMTAAAIYDILQNI